MRENSIGLTASRLPALALGRFYLVTDSATGAAAPTHDAVVERVALWIHIAVQHGTVYERTEVLFHALGAHVLGVDEASFLGLNDRYLSEPEALLGELKNSDNFFRRHFLQVARTAVGPT